MGKSKQSHQCRAGYCLSSQLASQWISPGARDSSAEGVRQQIIKAYLRRPVLGGHEAGHKQPVSLADAIERAEGLLDGCDGVAV